MGSMTLYVKCVSRQISNFVKNGRILMKFDMSVHMDVLSDFMLLSFSKDKKIKNREQMPYSSEHGCLRKASIHV